MIRFVLFCFVDGLKGMRGDLFCFGPTGRTDTFM